jgi:hypothetical protein
MTPEEFKQARETIAEPLCGEERLDGVRQKLLLALAEAEKVPVLEATLSAIGAVLKEFKSEEDEIKRLKDENQELRKIIFHCQTSICFEWGRRTDTSRKAFLEMLLVKVNPIVEAVVANTVTEEPCPKSSTG